MTFLMRLLLATAFGTLVSACRIDDYFLYYPQPLSESAAAAVAKRFPAAEEVTVDRDGVRLHGWLIGHRDGASGGQRKPLVIYYSGNAEEVSWLLEEVRRFPTHAFLLMNYRGFGRSTGKPHESTLYADALAMFDAITRRPELDRERVLLWARSLGTGVAVHVATQRPVAGLVLVSPYDSITALAALHQPLLKSLLTQHFDSIAKAPALRAPMTAIAAVRDDLIPIAHTERLVNAWGTQAKLVRLLQGGHQTLHRYPEYWQAIDEFLQAALLLRR